MFLLRVLLRLCSTIDVIDRSFADLYELQDIPEDFFTSLDVPTVFRGEKVDSRTFLARLEPGLRDLLIAFNDF